MPPIEISQSELTTWARCPRKWYVSYYLGCVPAEEEITGNRILGTRVHTALEAWQGYDMDPLAVLGIIYQLVLDAHPEASQEILKERELATIMVSGYTEWLAAEGLDAHLETVATEAEVKVAMPGLPGVVLRARLDAVVQDSDGFRLFRDYKTSANFDRHEILAMDFQMKFYSLVMALKRAEDGSDAPLVRGGMIDTLRRVKRSSRSTPPYYQRDTFRYNADELTSAARRTGTLCREITDARALLDDAAARGNDLTHVNYIQQSALRPVPILNDCSWSCPLAQGTCTAMDDGSDWPGILTQSGKFVQQSPYLYYQNDPIRAIRAELAKI